MIAVVAVVLVVAAAVAFGKGIHGSSLENEILQQNSPSQAETLKAFSS